MARVRIGVVMLVPHPLAAEIDGLRRATGDGSLDRVPPHCTLVPPVNVREDALDQVLAGLRHEAHVTAPIRATLGPPATFLPLTPVLQLPVTGDDGAITELRGRVFRPPLDREETWSFVPHVTLADNAEPARIEAAIEALRGYITTVTFDRLHVLQEQPSRRWEPIIDAAFAEPAVIGRGGLPLELELTTQPAPTAGRGSFAITARRHGDEVGRAVGWIEGDTAELVELTVTEANRHQGIGTHLLKAVEQLADSIETSAPADTAPFLAGRGWRETSGPSRTRWRRTR
jgi:2'-5' RNA ligase